MDFLVPLPSSPLDQSFDPKDPAVLPIIVEVSCEVDFDDLDPDDCDTQGNCTVDGSYRIFLKPEGDQLSTHDLAESALDVFHKRIPIACLDDFCIIVRPAGTRERTADPSEFRSDLGLWPAKPHDLDTPEL